jgi:hypothetical protein
MELITTVKKSESMRVMIRQAYDDGSEMKIEVPTHKNMKDVETIFYCMDEFREAARRLEYENDDLYTHYRETLRDDARLAWDLIVKDYLNRTTEEFTDAFRDSLIKEVVDEQAQNNLIAYLRHAVKPKTLTPKMLSQRVHTLCQ